MLDRASNEVQSAARAAEDDARGLELPATDGRGAAGRHRDYLNDLRTDCGQRGAELFRVVGGPAVRAG